MKNPSFHKAGCVCVVYQASIMLFHHPNPNKTAHHSSVVGADHNMIASRMPKCHRVSPRTVHVLTTVGRHWKETTITFRSFPHLLLLKFQMSGFFPYHHSLPNCSLANHFQPSNTVTEEIHLAPLMSCFTCALRR